MRKLLNLLLLLTVVWVEVNSQISILNNELEEVRYNLKVENGETIVTVPVPMPKGANNFAPKIDLVYRSNAHSVNRDVGVAWYLSGLHEISRCPKSFYFDRKASPISYSYADAFCYDGQRLILTDGLYGYDKSEYRTEIDNQQKVVANGVQGRGPKTFKVFTKDNLIMTFGDSSDSFLSPMLPNNTNLETISRWYLTTIEDYNQNKIRFSYMKEKNYCYLSSVMYANRAINFVYESRTDVQTKYYSNYLDVQMNKRLKNVSITVARQELKRLELEYTRYSSADLSLLKNVKLCVTDTCARPLEFDYDLQSGRFASAQYVHDICGTSDVCELKQVADMNGDGLVDVVAFGGDGVYVSLNSLNSFLPATKWTLDFSRATFWTTDKHVRYLADMNNDGLPDIVGFGEDAVYVSYNANGYFHKIEKYFNGYGYNTGWRISTHLRFLSDVDNDGVPDLIGLANTGSGLTINNINYFVYSATEGWGTSFPFYLEDVNGDGFKDAFGIGPSSMWFASNQALGSAETRVLKNGNIFLYSNGWRVGQHGRMIIDVNDDNLADIVGFSSGQAYLGLSSVDGQLKNEYTIVTGIGGFSTVEYKFQYVRDVNGDGLVDLVSFECNGVYVALNNKTSFLRAELWATDIKSCDTETRDFVDMNGDHLLDLVAFYGNTVKIGYNANKQGKLVQLKDSFRNIKRLNYSTLAVENANKNLSATKAGAYSDFGSNPDVVGSLTSSDGTGGTNTVYYSYGPYRCGKIQGRTDCAFMWVKSTSKETDISTLDEFYHEYPLTNVIKRKRQSYKNTLLQDARFSYSVKTRSTFINQVLLQQKSTDIFDLNGEFMKSESTEILYDIYGNSYKTTKNVTDNKETYSKVSQYEFKNNETIWWIGQLSSQNELVFKRVNKTFQFYPIKEEFYEYNQISRNVRRKLKNPNDDVGLEDLYTHDSFGNIIATSQKALKSINASEIRSSFVTYDSNGLNIIQRKNSLSHQESFKYDLLDNIIENSDINNITSYFYYNKFGRKTQSIENQGTLTKWLFEWDSPKSLENSVYRISSFVNEKLKETIFYDSLNREIRTAKVGINGEIVFENSIYNGLGQLAKQSMPYKPSIETAKYTVYEYDALSREVNKTELMKKGETLFTEYFGFKTIKSDHLGRILISTGNVLGQIVSVEDAAGSIAFYDYDAYGNLLKIVDPQGSTITMRYNINGQKVFKNDTFTGIMYYTYNAFDELMRTKHSSGKEIRFQRDSLGRMTTRVEPEGQTTWVYDTANGTGIGKLHKVIGPSDYTNEFKYDRYSRVIEQTYSYDRSSNYTVSTEYDRLGRISAETYPSNVKIFKCYNDNGYLYAASLNDSLCRAYVWRLSDSDARGNIVREQFGNNVITDYAYTEVNQIASINSFYLPSHKLIRKLDYNYNRRQNLISKSDIDSMGKHFRQSYDYDSLNRLTLASSFETVGDVQRSIDSSAWMYDSIGNFIFTDDGIQRPYIYDDKKPQQAVRIGTESLKYDEFGNVVESDAYKVDWYSFLKAKSITTSSQRVAFSYGPDRELISKTLNNGNTTVHYLGNTYEKWVIRTAQDVQTIEKYFIRVLDKIVATRIVSQNLKAPTPRVSLLYQHNDAFSSVDSITDENGLLVLKYNYTAFGKVRVAYSNLSPDLLSVLNSGYSGHNHIEGDRLVNMNGRIFDTVFLRFLSPDPFVQDIYNIQNLNRYSYALNNPFNFNDPNGFFFKKIWKIISNPKVILAVAVAVATAGLASAVVAPALIGVIGVSSASIVGGVISGAVVGSMSGFASSMVLTDGNVKESLKGAALGAVGGAIAGGLTNAFLPGGASSFGQSVTEFASKRVGSGVANVIDGRKFFDGIETSAFSFAAAQFYKAVVGYEVMAESGGKAAPKTANSSPVKGANNIGCQGGPLVCGSTSMEGGALSVALNKVGGINAIAGMHDTFQINLDSLRDILNVPGTPLAAAITGL